MLILYHCTRFLLNTHTYMTGWAQARGSDVSVARPWLSSKINPFRNLTTPCVTGTSCKPKRKCKIRNDDDSFAAQSWRRLRSRRARSKSFVIIHEYCILLIQHYPQSRAETARGEEVFSLRAFLGGRIPLEDLGGGHRKVNVCMNSHGIINHEIIDQKAWDNFEIFTF